MKEVVKVSIARVSFTLDKDAHDLLDNYLTELKEHYVKEESSQEIIEDIEERIMELFVERGLRDRVVALEDVDSVIKVLGHPKDIDAESGCYSGGKAESETDAADSNVSGDYSSGSTCGKGGKKGKKLYRDVYNKVLGGVCSGLGVYFNIDVVIVRILFILLAFIVPVIRKLWVFGVQGYVYGSLNQSVVWGFVVVLYIILWIIVPPAKTVAQRCEMNGESLGVDDIKRRVSEGARRMGREVNELGRSSQVGKFFGVIGRIIMVCVGIFLLCLGFTGLVTGALFCIGVEVFENVTAMGLIDYVELGIDNVLLIKVLGMLVWFLPCIGMIYGGLALCFVLKTKWRLGLIIFILWLVALFGFITYGVKAASPYYNPQRESVTTDLPANYDTLYINMKDFAGRGECKAMIEEWDNYLKLAYVRKKGIGSAEIIAYPTINIVRRAQDSTQTFTSHVDYSYNTYSNGALIGSVKLVDMDRTFSIKDSLITVNYKKFNRNQKYNGERESLYIYIPDRTVVKWVDDDGKERNFRKK